MVKNTELPPIVEAVGLSKVFRDFWMREKARAVDNVDFEIRPNELFGLLGPNGSGKSTIIKMVLGLLHKTSGRLLVFGKDPSDVMVKRHIGFLPEESYLYRYLTAHETLDYYAKLFGLDRRTRKRRTGELLEMVGLTHMAHRAVGEFSKGMTRRIGIAQALINDPEFLILDEPTSGLDPIGTRQVKDLLLDLRRRGKTILLSSHLLSDVEDVCDRMVMLYGGRIRAEGTAGELLRDTDRTVISTQRLTDEQITQVRAALAAAGADVESIEAPTQRLESLFLEIVERAQQERVSTSGATHAGETASFLRGEGAEGGELVDALVADDEPEAARPIAVERSRTPDKPTGPKTDVLEELMEDRPADPAPAAKPRQRAADTPQVDRSLIDSLTDDDDAVPPSGSGA